ncbi:MAG: hypothetical protein MUO17_00420 [Dehalococcoidales bacterium]|jgi:hypothetical protein|nr:hypothetical protein [Dehalococcoidales bacterium]
MEIHLPVKALIVKELPLVIPAICASSASVSNAFTPIFITLLPVTD